MPIKNGNLQGKYRIIMDKVVRKSYLVSVSSPTTKRLMDFCAKPKGMFATLSTPTDDFVLPHQASASIAFVLLDLHFVDVRYILLGQSLCNIHAKPMSTFGSRH